MKHKILKKFVAICLISSLVPVSVFATESGAEASEAITVSSADEDYPTYTVQYYANIPSTVVYTTESAAQSAYGNNYLEALDTRGKNLPENSSEQTVGYIGLTEDADNSGTYEMDLVYGISRIYKDDEDREYNPTDTISILNILSETSNYTLDEIWVLKEGKSSSSTESSDWDQYPVYDEDGNYDPPSLVLEASGDGSNEIVITDDTVIRLVYATTTDTYTNDATFYDYDITEDSKTTQTTNGDAQGINNPANYDGEDGDIKLAFGNSNTGTGLGLLDWEGNTLNSYNYSSYNGATFGLVSGLDDDGNLIYSDGVVAPNLFNDGEAIGKTTYGNYSLNFRRDGDTYILSSVVNNVTGETAAADLDSFNHPETDGETYDIWTNNFWPMDDVSGTDGHTGKYYTTINDYYVSGYAAKVAEETYTSGTTEMYYPSSDDGIAHNNLFGMTYSVSFTLDSEYVGDLEYFFFGDDDLWVFLTDPSGESTLVCDLGGVHSSIGAYVDLWDYARDSDGNNIEGTYTLTFFYTERGLSGSTCFMQFTLPEVIPASVTYDFPDLDKEVKDASTDTWGSENTAEIGDAVNFQTTITVGAGYTEYVLHDVLDAGFTLDATSIALAVGESSLVEGTDYEVILDTTCEEGCSFEIEFSDDYLGALEADTEIVVSYSAVLNENAVIYPDANLNTTWLEYTYRDAYTSTTYKTEEEETETYAYDGPDLDKKVKDASTGEWVVENTAEIGETVDFKTTITVGESCSDYVLHDVLDAGFTLDATSIALDSLVEGTDYEVILETTDGCSFEIAFANDYLDGLASDTEIIVSYSAVLNENAVIYPDANLNTTWLGYNAYSYSSGETPIPRETEEKETKTYTYEDPDLDKKVKDASTGEWVSENTAEIGDAVNFQTTITVGAGYTEYVLHDVLDAGFTLDATSIALAVGESSLVEGTDYEVILETSDGCGFEIAFTNDYLSALESGTEIVVTYSAVLNENAVIYPDANLNTTWLDYAYDSETYTTGEKETKTYTYTSTSNTLPQTGDSTGTLLSFTAALALAALATVAASALALRRNSIRGKHVRRS